MINRFVFFSVFLSLLLNSSCASGNQSPNPDAKNLFSEPASAIFFEYVGVVKKPIPSIFISSKQPNLKNISNVFKYCFGHVEFVDRFIISEKDLNQMIEEVKNELSEKKQFPETKFLKVDVGIVENGKLKKRTLSKDQALLVLSIVQDETKEKYSGLFKAIGDFKSRIGGGR